MQQHSPSPGRAVAVDIGDSMQQQQHDPFTFMQSNFELNSPGADGPSGQAGAYPVSGTMEPTAAGGSGSSTRRRHLSHSGAAGAFLESKGFGWLLDEEDDQDDIFQQPLLEELDIDLTDIYYKVRCVLLPLPYFRLKLNIVRENPDFWGPLLIVLLFSVLSIYGQMSVVSWIMTIWVFGSFIIFFLARVLGGDVGYTQCLGIIGYCLIPLVLTGLVVPVVSSLPHLAMAVKMFGLVWAVYSSGMLLCVEQLAHKKTLLLYPIALLYAFFLSIYTGV